MCCKAKYERDPSMRKLPKCMCNIIIVTFEPVSFETSKCHSLMYRLLAALYDFNHLINFERSEEYIHYIV